MRINLDCHRLKTLVGSALAAGLLSGASAEAADRQQLGVVPEGETLVIAVGELVAASRIRVEIDGQLRDVPIGVRGQEVSIRVPDDLDGSRHDLVLFLETSRGSEHLGSWEFETSEGEWGLVSSIRSDIGVVSDGEESRAFASIGGRFDYDLDDGRVQAGLSILRTSRPDAESGDHVRITDYFLETRGTLGGNWLKTRFGSHYYLTDGHLIDESTRRGVSLRFQNPSGDHDTSVYAMRTTVSDGLENISGLEDSQDRLYGVTGFVHPVPDQGLRLSYNAYDGQAPELPSGQQGEVTGYGLALNGPIGDGRADFSLSMDKTMWRDGTGWHDGTALDSELTVQLLPLDQETKLAFSAGYARTGDDFFSPLNPDMIVGEESLTMGLEYFSHEWDWSLEAAAARTNTDGKPDQATDRISRVTFRTSYSPDVFTGGFLNGTTFYFDAQMQRQDRLETPEDAPDPQDNTLWQFSLGLDRYQSDRSFALLYTYDKLDFRSGSGGDERAHGLEMLASYTPSDLLDASVRAMVRRHESTHGQFWEQDASASLRYEFVPDRWSFGLSAGLSIYEDPNKEDSKYLRQELEWEMHSNHSLVLSADYRDGAGANRLLPGEGWQFGLSLRSDLGRAYGR